MRTLLQIARKDATVLTRDKAALLVMLAMPLALIFILGSALGGMQSGGGFDIKVAIVNEDVGGTGELFVKGLTETEEIKALFNIRISDDAQAIRTDVEKGNLAAALIIPKDLTEKITAGEPVALEVLQDPGSKIAGGIWAGVVRAAVSNASAQIIVGRTLGEAFAGSGAGAAPPSGPIALDAVTVTEAVVKTEKRISMISYYAAGMTGMFLLFGSMFGAFSFVAERREQTLARMLVSPASKVAIVGGKTLGILMLAAGQFLVLLIGTRLLFQVDWGANVLATVLIGFAEAMAAAGFGMTLAALGKTERAIGGLGPAIIMLFAAAGGSMMPASLLPTWLKPLQVISPPYWAVDGFQAVMKGGGVADVLPHVGAMLAIGLVLFSFGVWRLRYE